MIIKDNDSSIEVLNIKEYASQTSSFWDEAHLIALHFIE
jgi:hypothetical protein